MTRSDAGHITKLGDHRWRVQVSSGRYSNGKRRRVSRNVRGTHQDAVNMRTKLLGEVGRLDIVRGNISVSELFTGHYLPSLSSLSPNTRDGYKSSFELYIEPSVGHIQINKLMRAHVKLVISAAPSPGAAQKAFKTFRQCIRHGIFDAEIVPKDKEDLFKQVKLPDKEQYVPAILNAEEMRQRLEAFRGHKREAVVILVECCGLRRSEVCALWRKDIDLERGLVSITKTWHWIREAGELKERPTKTKKSTRVCVIPEPARLRLKEILGLGAVAYDDNGQRDHPDNVSKDYTDHCKLLELRPVPLMSLRNSYGTLCASLGISATITALMFGHETNCKDAQGSSVYYKHYVVSNPELFREAQELVGKALYNTA